MGDIVIVALISSLVTPTLGFIFWHFRIKTVKSGNITERLIEKSIETYDTITEANKKLLDRNEQLTNMLEKDMIELKEEVRKNRR